MSPSHGRGLSQFPGFLNHHVDSKPRKGNTAHCAVSVSVFDKLADRYREKYMDLTMSLILGLRRHDAALASRIGSTATLNPESALWLSCGASKAETCLRSPKSTASLDCLPRFGFHSSLRNNSCD